MSTSGEGLPLYISMETTNNANIDESKNYFSGTDANAQFVPFAFQAL